MTNGARAGENLNATCRAENRADVANAFGADDERWWLGDAVALECEVGERLVFAAPARVA
jgi:hypothetical protein